MAATMKAAASTATAEFPNNEEIVSLASQLKNSAGINDKESPFS